MRQLYYLFRRFSLKHKLWFGFGSLGLVFIGMMLIITRSQTASVAAVEHLVQAQQPIVLDTLRLKGELKDATTSLAFYIISRDDRYKADYQTRMARQEQLVSRLLDAAVVRKNALSLSLLKDIQKDFHEIHALEEQLFEMAGDDYKRYPVLAYSRDKLYPAYEEVANQLSVLIEEAEQQPATGLELYTGFMRLHAAWLNVSRGMRRHIIFRNEDSRYEIDTNLEIFRELLIRMQSTMPHLGFVQRDALQKISDIYDGFIRDVDTFYAMSHSEQWAMDAFLIQTSVGPFLEHLTADLDALADNHTHMITALSQQILGNLQSATRQSWLMTVFGIVMIACGICTFSLVLLLPLKQLNQAMLSIEAQSNLNQRLDETGQDEFSEIATSFNRFVAKMRSMVELVIDASRNLTAESFKLSDLSLVSHRYVTEQKASLDACGTDLQTVTTTVESIAKDSQETLAAAQQASDQAASARRLVSDVIDQIGVLAGQVGHAMVSVEQLRTLSESIEEVMHIIRGITEQTNLLALNAAIEAARAGEQGRGFAVVAEEVRGMSCQVQSQTETIQAKIRALQEHVAPLVITMQTGNEMAQRSVGMAQAAGQGLQTITVAMERIIAMNAGIVDKVGQHHELVSRLSQAISAIGEMAQGSAVSSSQSAELAKEFNFLAKQLEQLVEQFVRHQSLARATLPAASWAHGSQAGDEDVELF